MFINNKFKSQKDLKAYTLVAKSFVEAMRKDPKFLTLEIEGYELDIAQIIFFIVVSYYDTRGCKQFGRLLSHEQLKALEGALHYKSLPSFLKIPILQTAVSYECLGAITTNLFPPIWSIRELLKDNDEFYEGLFLDLLAVVFAHLLTPSKTSVFSTHQWAIPLLMRWLVERTAGLTASSSVDKGRLKQVIAGLDRVAMNAGRQSLSEMYTKRFKCPGIPEVSLRMVEHYNDSKDLVRTFSELNRDVLECMTGPESPYNATITNVMEGLRRNNWMRPLLNEVDDEYLRKGAALGIFWAVRPDKQALMIAETPIIWYLMAHSEAMFPDEKDRVLLAVDMFFNSLSQLYMSLSGQIDYVFVHAALNFTHETEEFERRLAEALKALENEQNRTTEFRSTLKQREKFVTEQTQRLQSLELELDELEQFRGVRDAEQRAVTLAKELEQRKNEYDVLVSKYAESERRILRLSEEQQKLEEKLHDTEERESKLVCHAKELKELTVDFGAKSAMRNLPITAFVQAIKPFTVGIAGGDLVHAQLRELGLTEYRYFEASDWDGTLTMKLDLMVVVTSYIGHSRLAGLLNNAKARGIPVVYTDSRGYESIIYTIFGSLFGNKE